MMELVMQNYLVDEGHLMADSNLENIIYRDSVWLD